MKNNDKGIRLIWHFVYFLSFFLISLTFHISCAEAFLKIFTKTNYSILPRSLCATNDGYIVVGSIFDDAGPSTWGWVAKVDQNGKKQWQKEFGNDARDSAFYSVSEGIGKKQYILVGSVNGESGFGQKETSTGWLLKVSTNGSIEWDKTLSLARTTRIMDVKMTPDKNIMVVGRTRKVESEATGNQVDAGFIIKMDPNGNILWQQLIKKHWVDILYVLRSGALLIGGDSWISMTDTRGNIIWENSLREKNKLNAITEAKDGSLIISGNYESNKTSVVWIEKITSDGKLEFYKTINNKAFCDVKALTTDDENQLVAIGATCGNTQERIWSAIFDIRGTLKSYRKFQKERNTTVRAVLINEDGTFLSVGEKDGAEGISNGWIFKGKYK